MPLSSPRVVMKSRQKSESRQAMPHVRSSVRGSAKERPPVAGPCRGYLVRMARATNASRRLLRRVVTAESECSRRFRTSCGRTLPSTPHRTRRTAAETRRSGLRVMAARGATPGANKVMPPTRIAWPKWFIVIGMREDSTVKQPREPANHMPLTGLLARHGTARHGTAQVDPTPAANAWDHDPGLDCWARTWPSRPGLDARPSAKADERSAQAVPGSRNTWHRGAHPYLVPWRRAGPAFFGEGRAVSRPAPRENSAATRHR